MNFNQQDLMPEDVMLLDVRDMISVSYTHLTLPTKRIVVISVVA